MSTGAKATVIMKIDLAGPLKRGLAMGLNELAGYFAVAATWARPSMPIAAPSITTP